jgi:hypothetical protein
MFRQHHGHIVGATALVLGFALCCAPVAWADPQPLAKAEAAIAAHQSSGSPTVQPNPDQQGPGYLPQSPAIVEVVAPDSGFEWGDAGVGAGAALVIVGVALGVARAATNRRKRQSGGQRALVTN